MRTRKPLLMTLALALAAATLTATGQTVTPDGGSPIAAANLTTGALSTANTLTISGTWTDSQVKALRTAITGNTTPYSGNNATLTTVTFDADAVMGSMENLFRNCTALTGVTLPVNENTAAAVSLNSAFRNCTALKTVDLSKFTAIFSMENVFRDCTALTSVKMPASSPAGNFASAFQGCKALAGTVNLSGFTKIWSIDNAFRDCKALAAVKLGSISSDDLTSVFLNANPNLLKYLPAGSTAPAYWTNCIVDGKSLAGITLKDAEPFHCPEAFSMGERYAMSYTRTLTLTKDKWATLCLPFAAQVPADCVAKQLSGSTDASVSFGKVETLEANKPYIVAYTGNEPRQAVTFTSATAAQIPATPAALETAATDYKMAGTYADLIEQSMYLLNDNNSFLLYNAGNLHPFRACITAANGQPNLAPRLSISHDDGGVTGLDFTTLPAAASEVIPAVSRVYTLDGRLVKTVPAEEYATLKQGLERGIYVVNGKKMTVTE